MIQTHGASHDRPSAMGQEVHPDHLQLIRALDEAPMHLHHYLAWGMSSGGTLLDGTALFMLGIAIPLLSLDMALSTLQVGLLGAALVAGAVIGASSGGWAADRVGRKLVFLLDMGLLALAAALGAFAWAPWVLIGSQLLIGVGIGMDFPVSSSYVAECMPHSSRSRMMVATIACQSVGMLLAAVLALSLLHLSASPHVWRLFFASEAILAVLFLLARLRLPESPRWLMGHGRNLEAVHALGALIPQDRQMLETLAARLGREVHHVARVPRQAKPMSYGVLFQAAYLRRTLLSTLPWFLMDIATYGVGLFTAVLLAAMRFDKAAVKPIVRVESVASSSGVIDIFLLLGFLVGLWAVARFGRIRMQMIGFAGMEKWLRKTGQSVKW